MKIVHVLFYYDEKVSSEEELMKQYYTITGWAEALERKGAEVTVVYRFNKDNSFQKNGVQYHFIKDDFTGIIRSWQFPIKLFKKIVTLNADIVHLHHLTLSLQTYRLRQMLSKETGIVVQHHGGVAPGKAKRSVHNFLSRVADGFFFTTIQQGQEWFMRQKPFDKIMPVMEGATFFNYTTRDTDRPMEYPNRPTARKKTGMDGSPVFLWVGRLDDNKDPLTILNGFERLTDQYPEAKLYMIYSDGKLLDDVKEKLEGSGKLKTRVQLLGKVPHEEIEVYYNSADYFVLGSHYEGSGYALSEALVCGCVPIVTDIPSFRMMTNNGNLGALWTPGDTNSFINAMGLALKKPLPEEGKACIIYHKENLSFDAIANDAMAHYYSIRQSRNSK